MSKTSKSKTIAKDLEESLLALLILSYDHLRLQVQKDYPAGDGTYRARYCRYYHGSVSASYEPRENENGSSYYPSLRFDERTAEIGAKVQRKNPRIALKISARLDHSPGVAEKAWAEEKVAHWGVPLGYGTYVIMLQATGTFTKELSVRADSLEEARTQAVSIAGHNRPSSIGWNGSGLLPEDIKVIKCEKDKS